ncbi:glycosyltransferase [bacterium]|nr:glycosyltransferase [bacterium]
MVHIITALETGGAEIMLWRLLSAMDRRFEPHVITLVPDGKIEDRIRGLGIPIDTVDMKRGWPDPLALVRLRRLLRRIRPHLIQTWMYHADLLGGLAARMAGGIPVVWGIHHTDLDPGGNRRSTLWTARINARLAPRLARRIVCCSHATYAVHLQAGYPADRMLVIPNGFDLAAFRPDPDARQELRRELGLETDAPLVGMAARFHPQKDHRNFVRAAGILGEKMPRAHYVLWGDGLDSSNSTLCDWIREAGVMDRIHLLGRRDDVSRILAAQDVATLSSSYGEAFPLVIGEAMACGVPCAVTRVGDAAEIVGDTGRIVCPRDPAALAEAWGDLLAMSGPEREALGSVARRRIEENYALGKVAGLYGNLYEEVLKKN